VADVLSNDFTGRRSHVRKTTSRKRRREEAGKGREELGGEVAT
jgi:hypothetical protein